MVKKFILINAAEKTVSLIEEDSSASGWLDRMYEILNVKTIAGAYAEIDGKHITLTVDDEGMFRTDDFFILKGAYQPFAGSAILSTVDRDGEMDNVGLTEEFVKSKVKFMNRATLRRKMEEGKIPMC
jgi:hypothetical protein